jgi:prophage maintenance system killer protein
VEAVEGAREAAEALGESILAPPPLTDCDQPVIEAALATPRAGTYETEFYPDLPAKSAVLLYTLAKSQACPDGNKRLALILVEAFLDGNDATLNAAPDELYERISEAAVSDREERDRILASLTDWLRSVIAPLAPES